MGHINPKCTIDNFPYLFFIIVYCLFHYCIILSYKTLHCPFTSYARRIMIKSVKSSILNGDLWPKREEFCLLHAKLLIIFIKYLLSAVTQQCSVKVIYMGQCFFQVLMYEQCTVFSYSPNRPLGYSFTCDVPKKYSIMHTCIQKLIVIFNGYTYIDRHWICDIISREQKNAAAYN